MIIVVRYGSLMAIAAGVAGMLFCLPFLFSTRIADLVGAGFPFMGGAFLAGAGLIALSKTTFDGMAMVDVIVKWGVFAAIAAGIVGMFFCVPFLFSARMADLVGAGFPFIGGAIITGAGLIALSNLSANGKV
jgi:hypothetical protein